MATLESFTVIRRRACETEQDTQPQSEQSKTRAHNIIYCIIQVC
jgi:hypothetical protein